MNDLKKAMADPMSNVSRMLNKMEVKGLVKRVTANDDRRVVYVQITPAGIKLMCEGKERMDTVLTRFQLLTTADTKSIQRVIKKLTPLLGGQNL